MAIRRPNWDEVRYEINIPSYEYEDSEGKTVKSESDLLLFLYCKKDAKTVSLDTGKPTTVEGISSAYLYSIKENGCLAVDSAAIVEAKDEIEKTTDDEGNVVTPAKMNANKALLGKVSKLANSDDEANSLSGTALAKWNALVSKFNEVITKINGDLYKNVTYNYHGVETSPVYENGNGVKGFGFDRGQKRYIGQETVIRSPWHERTEEDDTITTGVPNENFLRNMPKITQLRELEAKSGEYQLKAVFTADSPIYTPYDATSTQQGVVWLSDEVPISAPSDTADSGSTASTPKALFALYQKLCYSPINHTQINNAFGLDDEFCRKREGIQSVNAEQDKQETPKEDTYKELQEELEDLSKNDNSDVSSDSSNIA